MTFVKRYLSLVALMMICPLAATAELPRADSRPFWTQKTCYIEGDIVYGVGLSMNGKELEVSRKKSFDAALWEIAKYAGISDTSLLFVETQMTYEEENRDKTYSVWRLVKVPQKMLENTKKAVKSGKPVYRELADKIRRLETENRQKEADALRRSVAAGTSIKALKQRLKKLSTKIAGLEKKIERLTLLFKELEYKSDRIDRIEGTQPDQAIEINWTKRLIRAKGFGIPNQNDSVNIRAENAKRAAEIDAKAKLVGMVNGEKIKSIMMVRKRYAETETTISEISGKIRHAYLVRPEKIHKDGTVEVLMEVDVKNVLR